VTTTADSSPNIVWGRCRDTRRWFWYAHIIGGTDAHGWAKDRNTAGCRANAAAVKLAAGQYAAIRVDDQAAEIKLAATKAAKQSRPKAEKRQHTAAGDGAANLYAIEAGYYDHAARRWVHSRMVRLPIVKKTAKRIYYLRSSEPGEFEQGYIDRQSFEAHGWVWSSRYDKIWAQPPEVPNDKPFVPPPFTPAAYRTPAVPSVDELKRLKAVMAAAHPDRGGTDAEFIAAHQKYEQARRRVA
jgi:hypothetical protein